MSNDSIPTQPERPEPRLPQFDPTSTGAPVPPPPSSTTPDETQVLPSTPTARTPIVPPAAPYAYAAGPASAPESTPAVSEAAPAVAEAAPVPTRTPRWSAKKTAVTAGLALVLTSAGAIAAAAAIPAGSTAETGRFGGPGQGRTFPFPGGQGPQGQLGQGQQVAPNQQGQQDGSQLPGLPGSGDDNGSDTGSDTGSGGGLTRLDADQLLQLSPDELLQLLDEQGQLGSGQPSPFGQDDQSQDDAGTQTGATRTT
ncbi:hypothetical protein [Humibacillus xanthopallidus]|uniref:hypothetical protein n=1 Tax=Humibacillus xanthopallidus TaxID=412689 RepID=UPI00384C5C6E